MATQQQLQQWLDDCEQALQDLSTGQKAVSVASTSGKSVTFTAANIGLLRTRIAELNRQLGNPSGIARPIHFRVGGH